MGTPKYGEYVDPNDPGKGITYGGAYAPAPDVPVAGDSRLRRGSPTGEPLAKPATRAERSPTSGGGTGGTVQSQQRPAPFSRRRLANDAAGMASAAGTSLLTRRR